MDDQRNTLDGLATIFYRSGADSALPALYLHTYPNAFSGPNTLYAREAARIGEDCRLKLARRSDLGWMTIVSASVNGHPVQAHVEETLARVDLPKPLAPGDSLEMRLHFRVGIPINFDRLGHTGDNYSISQWYPKLVVYDDLGWHLDPFHFLSEFYGEYASYDVSIELPDEYWVGATGTLRRAEGGDNEVPLFRSEQSPDSISVSVQVAPWDTLSGRWPGDHLEIQTDLYPKRDGKPLRATVPRGRPLTLRVPRGAPLHYAYVWHEPKAAPREESDPSGGAGPLHLVRAFRDTTVTDTLRALAAEPAPGDTLEPSLKTLHYHADRVHDFALVASPDYVRSDTTWSGIQVRALVFRDDEIRWRDAKGQTVAALRHFTRLVGPYVWPRFTTAEAFCGGSAMEYPMLIMNEPSMYSELFHQLEDTIAHELGHNWFYGMLGSDERADPWLDEGFTQYIEHDYTDRKYPLGLFRYARRFPSLGRFTAMDDNEQRYLARAWARDELPIATSADRYQGYPQYGVGAYSKPASMLHTLRGILGDSSFIDFLHEYYRRNLLRHPRPADVIRAANDASGMDLAPYFRSWIETLDRPSFALGKVRRVPSGTGWRNEVTVRRLGEMKLPVTVEARFADGTRAQRPILVSEREATAVFESRSRLAHATVDPHHDLIEMNRLDNEGGLIPPTRFHFLYGFPSAEAIGVDFGPTIWHGESEGLRLGGWATGTYLPSRDFPQGILGFESGLSIGTKNGSVAYRGGAWKRWGLLGARGEARGLVTRDAGLFRAGLSLSNLATAPGRRHPFRSWELTFQYRDRDELDPVDPRYWSLGRIAEGGANLGLETIGPRRLETLALSYRHGASAFRESGDTAPPANYDWVYGSARETLDLLTGGALHISSRVAVGSAFRRVPLERQFDIAQESRLDALRYFYANDRGPLRESDHFLVPGGGGLRGYADQAILGQQLLAWNVEAEHDAYPIYLFGDMGRVEASGWGEGPSMALHPLVGKTLADAGIGIRYGPLEVAFPVWVGKPETGESPWRFRWFFSIGPLPLPTP